MVESSQIPSLTEDIVYCPKCGTINSFKKSTSGKLLNYFCNKCGVRMNDLWDRYQNGIIKPLRCFYCSELTFNGEVYCIACGVKQKKVRKERVDKLANAKVKDSNSESSREGTDKYDEGMRVYFIRRV